MVEEAPSAERIAECIEVVGEQLLIGGLDPLDVPLPMPAVDSSFLDGLEHEIFADADALDAQHLRCERGAWRLVRRLADDDLTVVRALCDHLLAPTPVNSRLRRLMAALRGHVPILPSHFSRTLH